MFYDFSCSNEQFKSSIYCIDKILNHNHNIFNAKYFFIDLQLAEKLINRINQIIIAVIHFF